MAALIEQVRGRALSISRYDLVGKGDKSRQVLIPAAIARPLLASRGGSDCLGRCADLVSRSPNGQLNTS